MHATRRTDPAPRPSAWRAMDVGGSHATAAVVALAEPPHVLARSEVELQPHSDREALLGSIASAAAALPPGPERWTVAMPGPFDYARGTGSFAGVAKFRALAGVDLRAELGARIGVLGDEIAFVNDATAYGVGEWAVSADRADRFVCVTLGTGIGSVFLDRGAPVDTGPEVPPHGWAHLIEVAGVPLEEVVSTRAIQRRWTASTGQAASVREIAERARSGDVGAVSLLDTAMEELGDALAPWVRRFGASELVVGGSMTKSWDLLMAGLRRGLAPAGPIAIRPANLRDDAPLIGAATLGAGQDRRAL